MNAIERTVHDDVDDMHVEHIAELLGRQLNGYTAMYQVNAAEQLGLTLNDTQALELIVTHGALATGQLAYLAGVSAGGATAMINRLEAAGLVRRDRHPSDRRIVVIRPILERCTALVEARRSLTMSIDALAKRYPPEELQAVERFLCDVERDVQRATREWLDAPDSVLAQHLTPPSII